MNTHLNIFTMTFAAMLLGLVWFGGATAQDLAPEMPGPHIDRASCDEVNWHRDLLRNYPWVADACQEAIVVDGEKWARFEARFKELHRDGSITSDFRDSRGRSLGSVRLMPGPNQRVLLDGRPYRFTELKSGQTLNFYVPDDLYTFTTQPGAPASEQGRVVQPPEERQPERMAEARSVASATRPTTLPATAGPLPIIALGGALSLLAGLGLTMRRRLKAISA